MKPAPKAARTDAAPGCPSIDDGPDVYANEPLSRTGHALGPLLATDDVILLPHPTCLTREAMQRPEEETPQRRDQLPSGSPVLLRPRDPRLAAQRHGVRLG